MPYFREWVETQRALLVRLRSTPTLAAFAIIVVLAQGALGVRMMGGAAGLTLPVANLLFGSVFLFLARRSKEVGHPPLRAPKQQIAIASVFVAVHIAGLMGQFPNRALADNPLTRAIGSLFAPLGSAAAINMTMMVVLPALALLPWSRRRADFGLTRLPWRLLIAFVVLYAPLFALAPRAPTWKSAALYMVVAAFPEELLYRALLQQRLRAFLARESAIVLTATVFGLMHLPVNSASLGSMSWALVQCFAVNAFGGALFGYLYERTQSLLLVSVVHWWAAVVTGGAS